MYSLHRFRIVTKQIVFQGKQINVRGNHFDEIKKS